MKKISKETFLPLVSTTDEELELAKDAVVTAVNNIMNKEIPIVQLTEAKEQVVEELQYAPLRTEVLQSATRIGSFCDYTKLCI